MVSFWLKSHLVTNNAGICERNFPSIFQLCYAVCALLCTTYSKYWITHSLHNVYDLYKFHCL